MLSDPTVIDAWSLFAVLHGQRSVGFDVNPLAVADIASMLTLYGYDDETRTQLFELIVSLDGRWMSWNRERQNGDDANDSNRDSSS